MSLSKFIAFLGTGCPGSSGSQHSEDRLVAPASPRCLPGLIDGLAEEVLEDGEVFMARGQSHQRAPPHFPFHMVLCYCALVCCFAEGGG